MLTDACRPGDHRDVDQVEVPETAQPGLARDRDIERAAQLDGPVHSGRGRRFIGGVNGVGDVLCAPDIRTEEVEELVRLRIDAA